MGTQRLLYLSIAFFSKKSILQTGVQTFLFLSGIKNRVDFLQPSSCRDVYSGTKCCLKSFIGTLWFHCQLHIYLIACKFWATVLHQFQTFLKCLLSRWGAKAFLNKTIINLIALDLR